mmetsp:Transcript_25929/g.60103  ORF Transcript_25929/g.60103 Transcript_25929/m.60103 type:complete len:217 (+) Transcript_25929:611-1261(+)
MLPTGSPQTDALEGKGALLPALQPSTLDLDTLCAPVRTDKRAVSATVQPASLRAVHEQLLGGDPHVQGLESQRKLPSHVHAVAAVDGEALAHLLVPAAKPTTLTVAGRVRKEVEDVGGLKRFGKGGATVAAAGAALTALAARLTARLATASLIGAWRRNARLAAAALGALALYSTGHIIVVIPVDTRLSYDWAGQILVVIPRDPCLPYDRTGWCSM